MLTLMTMMRAYSPPTLLCKALSGCFLSRLLSPRSCNLQVLHALSEKKHHYEEVICSYSKGPKVFVLQEDSLAKVIKFIHLGMRGAYYFDLFAFTNNLIYRDKSSIFGGINNPPICSVLRFKALKILSLLMHNRFFLLVS